MRINPNSVGVADSRIVERAILVHQLPSTGRDGDEEFLPGQLSFTGAGDRNLSELVVCVNDLVACFKAFCDDHVVKLPFGVVIEVKIHNDLLDVGNVVGGDNVHIVFRAEKDLIQLSAVGNILLFAVDSAEQNLAIVVAVRHDHYRTLRGSSVDGEGADNGVVVAHIVLNGELDFVRAVGKMHIGDGNQPVIVSKCALLAIHVSLHGVRIQAGGVRCRIIRELCSKRNRVVGNNDAVRQGCSVGHAGNSVGNGFGNRMISVIDGGGIVDRKVVDIECQILVQAGIIEVVIIVIRIIAVVDIIIQENIGQAPVIGIGRGICINVVPVGLGILGIEANVPVAAGVNQRRGIIAIQIRDLIVLITRCDLTPENTAIKSCGLIRDIAPEAHASRTS